jgi:hypothetical protein
MAGRTKDENQTGFVFVDLENKSAIRAQVRSLAAKFGHQSRRSTLSRKSAGCARSLRDTMWNGDCSRLPQTRRFAPPTGRAAESSVVHRHGVARAEEQRGLDQTCVTADGRWNPVPREQESSAAAQDCVPVMSAIYMDTSSASGPKQHTDIALYSEPPRLQKSTRGPGPLTMSEPSANGCVTAVKAGTLELSQAQPHLYNNSKPPPSTTRHRSLNLLVELGAFRVYPVPPQPWFADLVTNGR